MKVVKYNLVVDGITYKVPHVVMTKTERLKWEYDAERFYQSTFNDLDMRVEPYEMNEVMGDIEN